MQLSYSDFQRIVRKFFSEGYTIDNGCGCYAFRYYWWNYTLTYTSTAIIEEWDNSTRIYNNLKDPLLGLMYHIAMNDDDSDIECTFTPYSELGDSEL